MRFKHISFLLLGIVLMSGCSKDEALPMASTLRLKDHPFTNKTTDFDLTQTLRADADPSGEPAKVASSSFTLTDGQTIIFRDIRGESGTLCIEGSEVEYAGVNGKESIGVEALCPVSWERSMEIPVTIGYKQATGSGGDSYFEFEGERDCPGYRLRVSGKIQLARRRFIMDIVYDYPASESQISSQPDWYTLFDLDLSPEVQARNSMFVVRDAGMVTAASGLNVTGERLLQDILNATVLGERDFGFGSENEGRFSIARLIQMLCYQVPAQKWLETAGWVPVRYYTYNSGMTIPHLNSVYLSSHVMVDYKNTGSETYRARMNPASLINLPVIKDKYDEHGAQHFEVLYPMDTEYLHGFKFNLLRELGALMAGGVDLRVRTQPLEGGREVEIVFTDKGTGHRFLKSLLRPYVDDAGTRQLLTEYLTALPGYAGHGSELQSVLAQLGTLIDRSDTEFGIRLNSTLSPNDLDGYLIYKNAWGGKLPM